MPEITACSHCPYAKREYVGNSSILFTLSCGKATIKTQTVERSRIVAQKVTDYEYVRSPQWCPLGINSTEDTAVKEEATKQLPAPIKTSYSYTEKRDAMKQFPRWLEWDDIKIGERYVIPRIQYAKEKIIEIESKTDYMASGKEIDVYGKPTYTHCTIYPHDLEAILMTQLKKY